jgi:hypothetical protein
MLHNFKWSVEKVIVTGDTNIVTHVYWRCDVIHPDLFAASAGVSQLTLGETFTAYEQLTEEQVLNWCLPIVQNKVELELINNIQQQLAQKVAEPALPWSVITQPE